MHHPSGEEPRINRLRENRSKALAAYQERQSKVTVVGNETVERLHGIETRLSQLQKDCFGARQQLSAALRESEECARKLESIDRELTKSEYQS